MVKNLSATLETWVQSLGQEDPLEKDTVVHFKTSPGLGGQDLPDPPVLHW